MALNDSQRQAIAAIDGPPAKQDTPEGGAQATAAPKSEASQMAEAPFIELDMGNGQKRKMTQEQILGITKRYSDLNFKHAQLAPVTKVIESYLAANPNMTPAQLAQQLDQLAAGGRRDVQFGRGGINDPDGDGTSQVRGQQQQQRQRQAPPSDDDFSKWETENASQLPPGYRDMHGNMQQMAGSMQQMMQMMQALAGATSGQVDAARQAHQGATQAQSRNVQATIGNNLDRVQQHLGLPDEAAQDFMMFAQERGYDFEDFVDPQLTLKVMSDFKNGMQSPEMDRLRQIHQRRTAFTSGAGNAPMGAGSQPNASEKDFSEFAGRVMQGRQ